MEVNNVINMNGLSLTILGVHGDIFISIDEASGKWHVCELMHKGDERTVCYTDINIALLMYTELIKRQVKRLISSKTML